MITILICVVLFLIGLNYERNGDYYYGFWDAFWSHVGLSVFAIILGVVVGVMIAFVVPTRKKEVFKDYHIESINDKSQLSGSFFLGTGNIEGKMKYIYYYKEGNRFKMNQVDYDKAEIEYTDLSPTVRIIEDEMLKPEEAFINWFSINIPSKRYLFLIPKGSIKSNYKLDAN